MNKQARYEIIKALIMSVNEMDVAVSQNPLYTFEQQRELIQKNNHATRLLIEEIL